MATRTDPGERATGVVELDLKKKRPRSGWRPAGAKEKRPYDHPNYTTSGVVRGMVTAVKIRKGTFRHIESELSLYHETKKEIIRLKNDIIFASPVRDENSGGGRTNWPGDPTGKTAVLIAMHRKIEQLERIVEAIESVYSELSKEKQELVRLKYWTKPQTLTWDGIALRLGVSRRTALNWRDEIISEIAEKIGWR